MNCSVVGADTAKYTTFDVPPPGAGFVTVIAALAATAMFDAGTTAVSLSMLTNVVARGLPSQLTAAPLTNPEPCTVSVQLGPPGGTLDGASG